MKLISCTEFVIEQSDYYNSACWVDDFSVLNETFNRIENYAKFLQQPLTLSMLVPCNDKGDVLEEPDRSTHTNEECEEFKKAKENVIFEGFEYNKNGYVYHKDNCYNCRFDEESIENGTIEDLVKYNLTITPNAINKYKLK